MGLENDRKLLEHHLIYFLVNPQSTRGVYPFFERTTADFNKVIDYLYSITSPESIHIMIPKSYIDEMDVVLMTLSGEKSSRFLDHLTQIHDSALLADFCDDQFSPKLWKPHPGRYYFMKDSAPGLIPIVVNELQQGALLKWCKDLCNHFGLKKSYAYTMRYPSGGSLDWKDGCGTMPLEFNTILKETFNIQFGMGININKATFRRKQVHTDE